MQNIDQLLEQDEVVGNHADARANRDAVERHLLEPGQNDGLCRGAEVGQAKVRGVAQSFQPLYLGGGSCRYFGCGYARKGGEGGIREVDQLGIQADNQHTFPASEMRETGAIIRIQIIAEGGGFGFQSERHAFCDEPFPLRRVVVRGVGHDRIPPGCDFCRRLRRAVGVQPGGDFVVTRAGRE